MSHKRNEWSLGFQLKNKQTQISCLHIGMTNAGKTQRKEQELEHRLREATDLKCSAIW